MWGGSSLGYKRAGFEVLGNVEIDPKINDLYITNNHPKYNYCEDLREFNKRDDLPDELFDLDILDGSPPCTSFSMVGVREEGWGKEKKFREGQAFQSLDDLFFVFLDTVEKLKPKIVVAENVMGIVKGKAKGYVNQVVNRFKVLGYDVQIFAFNSAYMDCPTARHRVFIIANRCRFGRLKLQFNNEVIRFGDVRSAKGGGKSSGVIQTLVEHAIESDKDLSDTVKRINGERNKYYSTIVISDKKVCPAITSSGGFYRFYDKELLTDDDFRNCQTFPQDYNFKKNSVQYVCGMSVPPNMMANVAMEIWNQWLK